MKMIMAGKALQSYRHIFFDMDGTLTESRSLIRDDINSALSTISIYYDIIVISGATIEQIYKQIPILPKTNIYVMGQSGTEVQVRSKQLWKEELSVDQMVRIRKHINECLQYRGITNDTDLVELRGGQVSFSFVGHNADLDKKRAFDPTGEKRRAVLEASPFVDDELMVKIGGTTCFDYTRKGAGKRGNTIKLAKGSGWNLEDCLYVGDQLYEGGNDEEMLDVMHCISVANPQATYELIKNLNGEKI